MQSLSPEEFQAVIAHEFGHLSGAHGRFGAWIYRLRTGWARLLGALQAHNHWGAALFTRFFNWYAPLFGAYSFVQARQQEYEADRRSVEAVGREATASALLRVNTHGEFLSETFWPSIFRRADEDPVPTMSPFSMLGSSLQQRDPTFAPDRALAKALAQRTGYSDTHPCLADRLKAIAVEPYVPASIESSAADVLLGATVENLRRDLDERWRNSVKQWWDRRHQYANESRQRLALLERKSEVEPLSEEEHWDRARFTEEFGSSDAAMALYVQLLERNPQHVGALVAPGAAAARARRSAWDRRSCRLRHASTANWSSRLAQPSLDFIAATGGRSRRRSSSGASGSSPSKVSSRVASGPWCAPPTGSSGMV